MIKEISWKSPVGISTAACNLVQTNLVGGVLISMGGTRSIVTPTQLYVS
jgi:hypothetical protein